MSFLTRTDVKVSTMLDLIENKQGRIYTLNTSKMK